jgi:uncharacterized integral membrane protein
MHAPEQERRGQAPAARTRRERARSVTLVGLVIVVTVFAVLNLDEVKVHWIVGSGHAPLIIVIVVSLLIGAVLSYFADRRAGKRR